MTQLEQGNHYESPENTPISQEIQAYTDSIESSGLPVIWKEVTLMISEFIDGKKDLIQIQTFIDNHRSDYRYQVVLTQVLQGKRLGNNTLKEIVNKIDGQEAVDALDKDIIKLLEVFLYNESIGDKDQSLSIDKIQLLKTRMLAISKINKVLKSWDKIETVLSDYNLDDYENRNVLFKALWSDQDNYTIRNQIALGKMNEETLLWLSENQLKSLYLMNMLWNWNSLDTTKLTTSMNDTKIMISELQFFSEIKNEQYTNSDIRSRKVNEALDQYICLWRLDSTQEYFIESEIASISQLWESDTYQKVVMKYITEYLFANSKSHNQILVMMSFLSPENHVKVLNQQLWLEKDQKWYVWYDKNEREGQLPSVEMVGSSIYFTTLESIDGFIWWYDDLITTLESRSDIYTHQDKIYHGWSNHSKYAKLEDQDKDKTLTEDQKKLYASYWYDLNTLYSIQEDAWYYDTWYNTWFGEGFDRQVMEERAIEWDYRIDLISAIDTKVIWALMWKFNEYYHLWDQEKLAEVVSTWEKLMEKILGNTSLFSQERYDKLNSMLWKFSLILYNEDSPTPTLTDEWVLSYSKELWGNLLWEEYDAILVSATSQDTFVSIVENEVWILPEEQTQLVQSVYELIEENEIVWLEKSMLMLATVTIFKDYKNEKSGSEYVDPKSTLSEIQILNWILLRQASDIYLKFKVREKRSLIEGSSPVQSNVEDMISRFQNIDPQSIYRLPQELLIYKANLANTGRIAKWLKNAWTGIRTFGATTFSRWWRLWRWFNKIWRWLRNTAYWAGLGATLPNTTIMGYNIGAEIRSWKNAINAYTNFLKWTFRANIWALGIEWLSSLIAWMNWKKFTWTRVDTILEWWWQFPYVTIPRKVWPKFLSLFGGVELTEEEKIAKAKENQWSDWSLWLNPWEVDKSNQTPVRIEEINMVVTKEYNPVMKVEALMEATWMWRYLVDDAIIQKTVQYHSKIRAWYDFGQQRLLMDALTTYKNTGKLPAQGLEFIEIKEDELWIAITIKPPKIKLIVSGSFTKPNKQKYDENAYPSRRFRAVDLMSAAEFATTAENKLSDAWWEMFISLVKNDTEMHYEVVSEAMAVMQARLKEQVVAILWEKTFFEFDNSWDALENLDYEVSVD